MAVIIHHEMLEVIADCDLILPSVGSTGGEECGKGTGKVVLGGELVDRSVGHMTVAGGAHVDWLDCHC